MQKLKYIELGLATIIMLLMSCSSSDRTKSFIKYASSIKELELPVSYSCVSDIPVIEVDSVLSGQFKPSGWYVSGRIYPHEKFVTILQGHVDYTYYPSIYTYSNDGVMIDKLELLAKCGDDVGVLNQTVVQINDNKSIIVVDSLTKSVVNEQLDVIPGLDSLFITFHEYKIDDSGHFIKVSDYNKIVAKH